MLLGIRGMLQSLLKILTRIPLSYCGTVITLNKIIAVKLTLPLFLAAVSGGFTPLPRSLLFIFFRLAHIQYITSYYHTAMCLCQRQAKEI